jgi:MFS transporter, FHS family, glucose/mannose:H+ symporter
MAPDETAATSGPLATRLEPSDVHFSVVSFAGTTVALGLIGAVVAAYGTFLVGIAHHFGVTISTAGIALSANFAGALVGVLVSWPMLRRHSGRSVLSAALLVLALGLSLAAFAPSWPVFVGAVALGGVGFGAIDFCAVSLVARTAAGDRASRLSISGAGWGFGAIVGPLLIVVIRPPHYEIFPGLAALVGIVIVFFVRGIDAPPGHAMASAVVARRRSDRRPILLIFLAALGTYVALETAVAGWLATQLHGWGYAATVGTLVTAGFWAGLAVGRLGAGAASRRSSVPGLVVTGLAVSVVLLLCASARSIAPIAYPLVGFALAAVFPLGLNWFTSLSPGDHDGVALLILVDMVGGIVGSGAENVAVAEFGLHAVPYVAAGFATLCLAMFLMARRFPLPSRVAP